MIIHERTWECQFCAKAFRTEELLMNHKQTCGTEKLKKPKKSSDDERKTFGCKICGREYATMAKCQEHCSIHLGKKFRCEICKRCFHTSVAFYRMCLRLPSESLCKMNPKLKVFDNKHILYVKNTPLDFYS